jgi:hypothetical protein
MALSDLYNSGGSSGAGVPTSSPVRQAPRPPKRTGPSPFHIVGGLLKGKLHFLTLAVGLITGAGFVASRVFSADVPTDSAVFSAIAMASKTAKGDTVEGVAGFRIGSCRRQITDDRAGDASQQWSCGISYTYVRAGARETDTRSVVVVGVHQDGMTATVCLDCGTPLHFIDRSLPDKMEGRQFVHLPSGGAVVAAKPAPVAPVATTVTARAQAAATPPPVQPTEEEVFRLFYNFVPLVGGEMKEVGDMRIGRCQSSAGEPGAWVWTCTLSYTHLTEGVRITAGQPITIEQRFSSTGSSWLRCIDCGSKLSFIVDPQVPATRMEGNQPVHFPSGRRVGGAK